MPNEHSPDRTLLELITAYLQTPAAAAAGVPQSPAMNYYSAFSAGRVTVPACVIIPTTDPGAGSSRFTDVTIHVAHHYQLDADDENPGAVAQSNTTQSRAIAAVRKHLSDTAAVYTSLNALDEDKLRGWTLRHNPTMGPITEPKIGTVTKTKCWEVGMTFHVRIPKPD